MMYSMVLEPTNRFAKMRRRSVQKILEIPFNAKLNITVGKHN